MAALSVVAAEDCLCSDDRGLCVDTNDFGQLCNLRRLNYSILACVTVAILIGAFADYRSYKPIV